MLLIVAIMVAIHFWQLSRSRASQSRVEASHAAAASNSAAALIAELMRDPKARPEVGQVLVTIVNAVAWRLKLLLTGVIVVLLSLGLAITPRRIKLDKTGAEMSGGAEDAPSAAQAVAAVARPRPMKSRRTTMPSISTMKLIGAGIAALLLILLVADRGRWMHRAHSDEAQLAAICAEVRSAADNPKLDCKRTGEQVIVLGESISAAKAAIADQNAKVAALGQETAQQQAATAKASQAAQERARTAEATSRRLDASSRSSAAQAQPCAPSKALTEAWR